MKKLSIKVLAFDSWTGGARHYQRLIPSLNNEGVSLQLVHLGSWGADKRKLKEEYIGELLVRDISYYDSNSFQNIIDQEKPSAVLFLSTDTFAHRAFNRRCQASGIPTIHLYHGLMSALAVDIAKPYDRNMISYFWFVTTRIVKVFTKVWPSYMIALRSTQATRAEWSRFITDNIDLLFGRDRLDSALDAKTDLCCIYAEGDRNHAVTRYGFDNHEVIAVGNPDIVQFGLSDDLIGSFLEIEKGERDSVMYIDTALVLRGATFLNQTEFIDHLISTKRVIAKAGKSLVVKLHPDHFKSDTPDLLQEMGVDICPNDQFISRLQSSCAVIVEPSSAAIIPALMGMPLLLARYGKLSQQHFGKILREYPIGEYLDEVSDFKRQLDSLNFKRNEESVLIWINKNSGPLPAELMPDRVLKNILKLIRKMRLS